MAALPYEHVALPGFRSRTAYLNGAVLQNNRPVDSTNCIDGKLTDERGRHLRA